jgi:ferredoxin
LGDGVRIRVDSQLCQGHNRCSDLAPDLFVLDDFGYSSAAADGVVPGDRQDIAVLAADNCPERAVIIEDAGG